MNRKASEGFEIAAAQKISREEALYAYTMGSAIANGDEQSTGSIEKGKNADFIISDNIGELSIVAKYINGEAVE
jgi:predicted amidohydrolase YtcJ